MTFKLRDGYEVRGMMIRLYPTPEQDAALRQLEDAERRVWNWLVKQTEEVISARKAYAVRNGLVPPRPEPPDCNGMDPNETKETWRAYREQCFAWSRKVHEATDKIPCCAWRPKFKDVLAHFGVKWDYQLFSRLYDTPDGHAKPTAPLWQALAHSYFQKSDRRKRARRRQDSMPLRTRTGDCFDLGDFGDRRGKPYYNCRVRFNGLKIVGRLPGRMPWGRVIEGVSITRQADGWWASIKQEIPIRAVQELVPGSVIGIDAGLDVIAAMSDGTIVENPRAREYAERVAGMQALKKDPSRLQQAQSRRVRNTIYNDVIKHCAWYETIKVERLPKHIGQMGSAKTSFMRTMVAMLKERYGDRVREVDPDYTSQDCSRCGHRSKEAWHDDGRGKVKTCPACGYRQHRDVNAAINIAMREPLPLTDKDRATWAVRKPTASGGAVVETQEALATKESSAEYNACEMAAE